MAVLGLLFRRDTPRRLRLMAAMNMLACAFVTVMTFLTFFMGFFIIVPFIFNDNVRTIFLHRCAIVYLLVNVCGNFIICVFTDTSTARKPDKRTKRNVSTRSTAQKTSVFEKNSARMSKESVTVGSSSKETEIGKGEKSGMSSSRSSEKLDESVLTVSSEPSSQVCKENFVSSDAQNNNLIEKKHASSSPDNSGKLKSLSSDTEQISSKSQSTKRTPASAKTDTQQSPDADPVKKKRKHQQGTQEEPERSHHCKLCEKRVLRRDHHCFFMMVCIGYHNHKHFIFFCLYMMIGAFYAVILNVRFLHLLYKVRFYGPQTFVFLLVQVIHNMMVKGLVPSPLFGLLLYLMYVCLAVGLTAGGFLYWHLAITVNGQTTHEASHGDERYRRRMTHNLRDVFGRYWPLLFLLPLPLPQNDDGRSYVATTTANNNNNNKNTTTTTTAAPKDNNNHRNDTSSAKTKSMAGGRRRGRVVKSGKN